MSQPNASSGALELTAIIVAYNSEDHIAKTLESLEETLAAFPAEVVVVDNASTDSTHARAREAIVRGRVIRLAENVGYGRGVNPGLQVARGRLSLILNDDVSITTDSLRLLMAALDSAEDVRLVAPRMVSPGGETLPSARRLLPGFRDEMARVGDLIRGSRHRIVEPEGGPPLQVDFVLAACLLGETAYLRSIGGFSDSFFMYGEDIDLCRRVKSLGGRVLLVPEASGRHDQAVAEDRRIRGRDFSQRILNARDTYYRIWLNPLERAAVNLLRSIGPRDQPFRLKYHLSKVFAGGGGLAHRRFPAPIEQIGDAEPSG